MVALSSYSHVPSTAPIICHCLDMDILHHFSFYQLQMTLGWIFYSFSLCNDTFHVVEPNKNSRPHFFCHPFRRDAETQRKGSVLCGLRQLCLCVCVRLCVSVWWYQNCNCHYLCHVQGGMNTCGNFSSNCILLRAILNRGNSTRICQHWFNRMLGLLETGTKYTCVTAL